MSPGVIERCRKRRKMNGKGDGGVKSGLDIQYIGLINTFLNKTF